MATYESLTIGGVELNDGVTFRVEQLDMPTPPKRMEWAQGADADGAALVRDPLVDNREITVRVRIVQQTTMDLALAKVGQLVDLLEEAERQQDGSPVVWTPADATKSVTFYCLAGEVTGLPLATSGDDVGWWQRTPVITVKLTCKPFGYGPPATVSLGSSSTAVLTGTLPSIPGDAPAEARLIVTDGATKARRYLEWGLEQRYYNASAPLLLDSDNFVTSGYGGHQSTGTPPKVEGTLYSTPIALFGTGVQPHVGSFRVKARVAAGATEPATVKMRLAWQVGDGPFRANAWTATTVSGIQTGWGEVDLGVVTIPPVDVGAQGWSARFEAYTLGASGSDYIDVDYLVFVPVAEGYGRARAAAASQPSVLVGRDDFTATAAGSALAGRTVSTGTWATSGATTDFAFADLGAGEVISRQTSGESLPGRVATLGTATYTDVEVSALVSVNQDAGTATFGPVARWVDNSNLLMAAVAIQYTSEPFDNRLVIQAMVGGSNVIYAATRISIGASIFYRVALTAYASGHVMARLLTQDGAVVATTETMIAAAATGGTLATGRAGLFDQGRSASRIRYFDEFSVGTPAAEPVVINAGRKAEIRSDGALREDSTGTYTGRMPSYRGSRFMVPPAGSANRTSRILVKAHRDDIETATCNAITDQLSAVVTYTPRYLAVPR